MRSIRGQFAHPIITWARLLTERVADCRSSADSIERPLKIDEPPINAADRSTVRPWTTHRRHHAKPGADIESNWSSHSDRGKNCQDMHQQ